MMSPEAVGLVSVAAILVLIALRMPIAIALMLVGFLGTAYVVDWRTAVALVDALPYDFAASWELSAAPMFLLMGSIIFRAGLIEPLFAAMRVWLQFLPGGLAVATNMACAVFAAASGSSIATAIAIGRFAIPEMLKAKYNPGLATAVCACAGTLGSMIPPSVAMIIYCAFTGQSVLAMFAAGILPGILTAIVYAAMIIIRVRVNPELAPPSGIVATRREKWQLAAGIWPLPLIIVLTIGSIYSGIATPTEAGALGAVVSALLAAMRGRLTLSVIKQSVFEALQATSVIFLVAIGASFLTRFIAFSGFSDYVASTVDSFGLGQVGLIVIVSIVYIILGCFLDSIGIMLLTLPIVIPVFEQAGINLIWFGVLMIKLLELGLMTPPVGMTVLAIKALVPDDIPLGRIYMGCAWFLFCELLLLVVLVAFPVISLWLPRAMGLMF